MKKWEKIYFGSLRCGLLYLATFVFIGSFVSYDNAADSSRNLIGNRPLTNFCGFLLFLIPYSLTAIHFAKIFESEPKKELNVVLALIATNTLEKVGISLLGVFIYWIPPFPFSVLVNRISVEGDPIAPWFTMEYIILTFLGCVILGAIVVRVQRYIKIKKQN